ALPLLRSGRHAGEGQPPGRRRRGHPPPPLLPRLPEPLHHLRAGAAPRTHGAQDRRPPRALRPREARPLHPHRAPQAPGGRGPGGAHRERHPAQAGNRGGGRGHVPPDRRDRDGVAARGGPSRLRPLRQRLPQLRRSEGLPGVPGRTRAGL
ncbi:MAG: Ribonucleotide reductase transcriptional regulator NrdR, partial [uncultured Acetobacteraceae bacterium]